MKQVECSGTVVDSRGRPVAGAEVVGCEQLFEYAEGRIGWGTPSRTTTDEKGRFQLHVSASGYGPTRLASLPFDAARSRQVEADPVTLPPADRSISGVIVDANDVPAPGVIIYVTGSRGSDTAGQPSLRAGSDQQGRFAINGVCAGPLRIQAGFRRDARGMSLFDAQGGDQDLKIVLGRDGARVEVKSLLGKPLPDGKDLIELDPEQTKGKPILLCFFDLSQRPSRRCIDVLAQQGDALRRKGVAVAAIQVAAADDDAWKAWVAERNAKLPFGQIRKDAEKVKIVWGVGALPWLILTDRDHVVRAEGFSLDELDGILARTAETHK